jgi:uncharacterized membrane protein
MKKNTFETILAFILTMLPFGYLASIWATLPEKVALHFGIDGQPDRFGSKQELLVTILMLMGVSFGIYFLLKNIEKIDPKQAAKLSKNTFNKLGFTLLVFFSLLSIYIVQTTISKETGNFLFVIMGALFIAMGNLMHSIKQNYFVGLRLPWTLDNEDNWRKTHQLGSKIWFIGGLFILIAALLFSFKTVMIITVIAVAIMVLIPSIYSYQLFKNQFKES